MVEHGSYQSFFFLLLFGYRYLYLGKTCFTEDSDTNCAQSCATVVSFVTPHLPGICSKFLFSK